MRQRDDVNVRPGKYVIATPVNRGYRYIIFVVMHRDLTEDAQSVGQAT
jgi:hypothetical protein